MIIITVLGIFATLNLFAVFIYQLSKRKFVTPTNDLININLLTLNVTTNILKTPKLFVTLNKHTLKITVNFNGQKSTIKISQQSGDIGPYAKYHYYPSPTFNQIIFISIKNEDGVFTPQIFFTSQKNTFDQVTFAPDEQTRYDANEDGSYIYIGKKNFNAKIGMQEYHIVNFKEGVLFKKYHNLSTDEIIYQNKSYTFTFKDDQYLKYTEINLDTKQKIIKKYKIDDFLLKNGGHPEIDISKDITYRIDGLVALREKFAVFINPNIVLRRTRFQSLLPENQTIDHAVVCLMDNDGVLSIPVEGYVRCYKKEQYRTIKK